MLHNIPPRGHGDMRSTLEALGNFFPLFHPRLSYLSPHKIHNYSKENFNLRSLNMPKMYLFPTHSLIIEHHALLSAPIMVHMGWNLGMNTLTNIKATCVLRLGWTNNLHSNFHLNLAIIERKLNFSHY